MQQAFAGYFRSDRFADADVCILHGTDERRSKRDNEQEDAAGVVLPVHLVFLCTSEYLAAQVRLQVAHYQCN